MTLIDEMLDQDDLTPSYTDPEKNNYTAVSTETVSNLDPAKPVTLAPHDSLQTAVELMQKQHIGAIIVADKNRPVGMFTERDILLKVVGKVSNLKEATLKDYMTPNPVCLHAFDKIAYALNQMTVGGFRHIPVIDRAGLLTGIISVRDIAEFVASLIPSEVYNIRPEPLRGGFMHVDGG